MNLKRKLEALLFSSGRKMSNEELMKLCRCNNEELNEALDELKKEYDEKQSSLMVVDEGNSWKITVREEHLPLIQKIVTQTELSKTLMETLAVIAFKYPIKQSDLIKIRTNKAYDHLHELEEIGYITRQKFGRTKLIKLTQKFFNYFSLPEEKLKEQFSDFKQIADAIAEKEKEIEKIKEDQEKLAEEARKEKEAKEKAGGIDIEEFDKETVDVYDLKEEKPKIEPFEEKLGHLDVVDEHKEEKEIKKTEEEGEKQESSTEESEDIDKNEEDETENGDSKDPAVEKEIENMLHPKEEVELPEIKEDIIDEIYNPEKIKSGKKKDEKNNKS